MTNEELQRVRQWAGDRIATGAEPPWSWFQLMKLRETLDAILDSMEATRTVNSPPPAEHQGSGLRLVASEDHQNSAQHRPSGVPARLPM